MGRKPDVQGTDGQNRSKRNRVDTDQGGVICYGRA